MKELVCVVCGKSYLVKPYKEFTSKCCSQKCSGISKQKRKTTKCVTCGKQITYLSSRDKYKFKKKFCSIKCRGISARARIKLVCVGCKKEFEVIKSKKLNRKYCSIECVRKYFKFARSSIYKTCKNCLKSFRVLPYKALTARFCSNTCSAAGRDIKSGVLSINYKNGTSFFVKYALKHRNDICSICLKGDRIETHHIDGNKNNNTLGNFLIVCKSCHKRIHILSIKNNLSPYLALEQFKELRLFELEKLEFREFWQKSLS